MPLSSQAKPDISCILVSHNKPEYVMEAIQSVQAQTLTNWELVIVDSGILGDNGFFQLTDPRIQLVVSGEDDELRKNTAMAPYCFNQAMSCGLVHGPILCYLCDDDIYYPNAFQTFVQFFKDHPRENCVYCSQDIGVIKKDGTRMTVGERRALIRLGTCCGPTPDCLIDYLQFAHVTRAFLGWPEEKATETHADGVFMDKLGRYSPICPVDVKIGCNRRTPLSTYSPSSR